MSIDVINESGRCRVRIEDELTIYTAGQATGAIRAALAANANVAIDVGGVTEIDTAGLQILLVARKEAMLKNRAVSFVGQNRVVSECLQLMNLANFFQFEAPAALAA
jgi:anti-anti-sigma factor